MKIPSGLGSDGWESALAALTGMEGQKGEQQQLSCSDRRVYCRIREIECPLVSLGGEGWGGGGEGRRPKKERGERRRNGEGKVADGGKHKAKTVGEVGEERGNCCSWCMSEPFCSGKERGLSCGYDNT